MPDIASRYASEVPLAALDNRGRISPTYAVFRNPVSGLPSAGRFRKHVWIQGDRWDHLAWLYFRDETQWYRILDYNPHVQDPFSIQPGTVIVVPTGGTG